MHSRIRVRSILVSAILATSLVAASAHAALIYKSAHISAAQEVPTNASFGNGTATFVIDTVANTMSFNISYQGLSSAETAAHIHGPAARGVNAGVLIGLPATNPKIGTWAYPPAQEANILAGLMYVNIHTTINPGGEIRGQIDTNYNPGTDNVPGVSQVGIILLASALLGGGALFMVMRRRRSIA
jgi:CHRD domain-containing protein